MFQSDNLKMKYSLKKSYSLKCFQKNNLFLYLLIIAIIGRLLDYTILSQSVSQKRENNEK